MFSWWDSLEAVTKFNLWVQWLGAIFTIFAAIFGVLILVSGIRMSALQTRQDKQAREQANARKTELQQRLEAAEKHTKDIMESRQGRSLTSEQRIKLLAFLRSSPRGEIGVASVSGIAEASDFASEIVDVLKEAEWRVSFAGISLGAEIPKGLVFQYFVAKEAPAVDIPAVVLVLRQALAEIGITTGDRIVKIPAELLEREDAVTLIVGRKPDA